MKRSWFSGSIWKPKNLHSLEHLRYLYSVLSKNQVVQESNRGLLVESLRSIAEILIWGDQNDSSVFDFFLEKNMLSFFLQIMKQKCGSYVCVQLLQTLNILFENIRNETSLYYLLSNNHVNSIIVHKFDFSDEEVMAYYISFLKTLSFKLNSHTIHFFYNEHTNDFPLYTEAIKFFNHSESMVRIAVRTISLNVYKVEDRSMLRFIRDKTAAPYFSNLVWFIGNHILELDLCIRTDVDHSSRDKLTDLVAEHLDHLHYLNDILKLNIPELNQVLAHHLLNRLLVPLLIYSLNDNFTQEEKPRVSRVVALFLLAQVFLIFSYAPLMQILCKVLFQGDNSIFDDCTDSERPVFIPPEKPLGASLPTKSDDESRSISPEVNEESPSELLNCVPQAETSQVDSPKINITDEEKEQMKSLEVKLWSFKSFDSTGLSTKPFLLSIIKALDCTENDYAALFSLCLLYAVGHNEGMKLLTSNSVNKNLLIVSLGLAEDQCPNIEYTSEIIECLLKIVSQSAEYSSKIRVSTLELTLNVLKNFLSLRSACVGADGAPTVCSVKDQDLAILEGSREEATLQLRSFYKGEEIFLDMFEDEWRELNRRPQNVEFLLQDASVLLPPTGTPLTGIDFNKRLPCGEVEKARRYMRVYFLIRGICFGLRGETDNLLPLTKPNACIQVSDVLNLTNSDLIACVVITRDSQRTRRFLVIDVIQLILVEPDQKKLGWGVAKFVGFLQDLEVTGDKDDSRVLHITIHRPSAASFVSSRPAPPLLAAKFIFDDHIRCMAAKQRLTKGRAKARQRKLHQIAKLLDLPTHLQPCPSPPPHALGAMRQEAQRRSSSRDSKNSGQKHKYSFPQSNRGPGIALKRDSIPNVAPKKDKNEDIPLDDLNSSSLVNSGSSSGTSEGKMVNFGHPTMSVLSVAGQVPYRTESAETSYNVPSIDAVQLALSDGVYSIMKPKKNDKHGTSHDSAQPSTSKSKKSQIETI